MGEAELVDKWVPSGFPAQKIAATEFAYRFDFTREHELPGIG
jgi:hypothetical protein